MKINNIRGDLTASSAKLKSTDAVVLSIPVQTYASPSRGGMHWWYHCFEDRTVTVAETIERSCKHKAERRVQYPRTSYPRQLVETYLQAAGSEAARFHGGWAAIEPEDSAFEDARLVWSVFVWAVMPWVVVRVEAPPHAICPGTRFGSLRGSEVHWSMQRTG